MWRTSRRGLAVRRLKFRREDGVAMTEFALILPIFMVIVAGLLGFGRVFFYWIQANHVANETARWAAVDHNPWRPLCPTGTPTAPTVARRCSSTERTAPRESSTTGRSRRLCASPSKGPDRRRTAQGHGREAVHLRADPEHRQRSPSARRRPCASRPSAARTPRRIRRTPFRSPTQKAAAHEPRPRQRAWSGDRPRQR